MARYYKTPYTQVPDYGYDFPFQEYALGMDKMQKEVDKGEADILSANAIFGDLKSTPEEDPQRKMVIAKYEDKANEYAEALAKGDRSVLPKIGNLVNEWKRDTAVHNLTRNFNAVTAANESSAKLSEKDPTKYTDVEKYYHTIAPRQKFAQSVEGMDPYDPNYSTYTPGNVYGRYDINDEILKGLKVYNEDANESFYKLDANGFSLTKTGWEGIKGLDAQKFIQGILSRPELQEQVYRDASYELIQNQSNDPNYIANYSINKINQYDEQIKGIEQLLKSPNTKKSEKPGLEADIERFESLKEMLNEDPASFYLNSQYQDFVQGYVGTYGPALAYDKFKTDQKFLPDFLIEKKYIDGLTGVHFKDNVPLDPKGYEEMKKNIKANKNTLKTATDDLNNSLLELVTNDPELQPLLNLYKKTSKFGIPINKSDIDYKKDLNNINTTYLNTDSYESFIDALSKNNNIDPTILGEFTEEQYNKLEGVYTTLEPNINIINQSKLALADAENNLRSVTKQIPIDYTTISKKLSVGDYNITPDILKNLVEKYDIPTTFNPSVSSLSIFMDALSEELGISREELNNSTSLALSNDVQNTFIAYKKIVGQKEEYIKDGKVMLGAVGTITNPNPKSSIVQLENYTMDQYDKNGGFGYTTTDGVKLKAYEESLGEDYKLSKTSLNTGTNSYSGQTSMTYSYKNEKTGDIKSVNVLMQPQEKLMVLKEADLLVQSNDPSQQDIGFQMRGDDLLGSRILSSGFLDLEDDGETTWVDFYIPTKQGNVVITAIPQTVPKSSEKYSNSPPIKVKIGTDEKIFDNITELKHYAGLLYYQFN